MVKGIKSYIVATSNFVNKNAKFLQIFDSKNKFFPGKIENSDYCLRFISRINTYYSTQLYKCFCSAIGLQE